MNATQYDVGDPVMCRERPGAEAVPGHVRLVDLNLLRLKVVFNDGREAWVYMERCFKDYK